MMERHNAALDTTGQFITNQAVRSLLDEARDEAYSMHSVSKATGNDKAQIDWSINGKPQDLVKAEGRDATSFTAPMTIHADLTYSSTHPEGTKESTTVGDPFAMLSGQNRYRKHEETSNAYGNVLVEDSNCEVSKSPDRGLQSHCSGKLTDEEGDLVGFITRDSSGGHSSVLVQNAEGDFLGGVNVHFKKLPDGTRVADALVFPAQDGNAGGRGGGGAKGPSPYRPYNPGPVPPKDPE